MVDDNGVWMQQQPSQLHANFRETELTTTEDLAEVTVEADVLMLEPVPQLAICDIKPRGLHDGGPHLCAHSQQPRQSRAQLVLERLMIQHEQEGALGVEVSGPFHLEAIRLLGGRHLTPLHQMVVRLT